MTTETIRRIDVEATAALWEKHHVAPLRLSYLFLNQGKPCGCLIGVLTVDALGLDGALEAIQRSDRVGLLGPVLAHHLGLDPDYAHGLDMGFSLPGADPHYPGRPPACTLGVVDGIAVRAIVFAGNEVSS